jgi:hypothetical protein
LIGIARFYGVAPRNVHPIVHATGIRAAGWWFRQSSRQSSCGRLLHRPRASAQRQTPAAHPSSHWQMRIRVGDDCLRGSQLVLGSCRRRQVVGCG